MPQTLQIDSTSARFASLIETLRAISASAPYTLPETGDSRPNDQQKDLPFDRSGAVVNDGLQLLADMARAYGPVPLILLACAVEMIPQARVTIHAIEDGDCCQVGVLAWIEQKDRFSDE